jgi:hypothetical protein
MSDSPYEPPKEGSPYWWPLAWVVGLAFIGLLTTSVVFVQGFPEEFRVNWLLLSVALLIAVCQGARVLWRART